MPWSPTRGFARLAEAAKAAAFWCGARATPKTAARAAARLWCRLPRSGGRRRDNRPHLGRIEHVPIGAGRRLAVEVWGPDDAPLVYLVHGWGGWRAQLGAFIVPLLDAGYRVLALDTASHGQSDPGRHGPYHSSGGEMIESLAAVAHIYGPAAGAVCHSLGCATAARAILDGSFEAGRLCLVAPNPDMEAVARIFGQSLRFPSRVIDLMIDKMASWARRTMSDFDLAAMADRLPPGVLIHDTMDKESPYAAAKAIAKAWPSGDFMTTEGYGHHRILLAHEVHTAAVAAIESAR